MVNAFFERVVEWRDFAGRSPFRRGTHRRLKTFSLSRKRVSTPSYQARRISSCDTKSVHEAALSDWFPGFPRLTHSALLRSRMFDSRRNSTSFPASRRPSEAFAKNTHVRRARGIPTSHRGGLLATSNLAERAVGPKPSLDSVMAQAQLEKKVEDYLRNSQALEDQRQGPLTAEQLQAEMNRMARNTKQPEVLRELFEALGNDPFVIAECLARPVLSERLLSNFARDKKPLESAQARAEKLLSSLKGV